MGFPGSSVVKNLPANAGDVGFNPWVGKIPKRREWQPILVFLPGKSHGQRSLVGCSPQGHKELDMTERLNNNNISIMNFFGKTHRTWGWTTNTS